MARVFDISSTSDSVRLDEGGHGQVALTATNVSGRSLRGRFLIRPLDALAAGAFAVDGEAERNFNPGATEQVAVKVNVPPGTKAGKYRFRLDGINIDNPDEDFTEGPALGVEVKQAPPPKPSTPWWLYAVAVLVLVAGGAVAYLFLHQTRVAVPDVAHQSAASASSALSALGLVPQTVAVASTETKNAVVKQDPPAGQMVKQGSTVTLSVASGAVELPKLSGSFKDASDRLKALGLVAIAVPKVVADAPPDQVVDQDPAAGQAVDRGSQVKLTVTAVPANPFVGSWTNQNSGAAVYSRLLIAEAAGKTTVHAYAKGPPELDLGTALAVPADNQLSATFASAQGSGNLVLTQQGSVLTASSTLFQGNNRLDQRETFVRSFRPRIDELKVNPNLLPLQLSKPKPSHW